MSSTTPNLSLLKKNPTTDGSDTFNIQTMLNDNWDKIDAVTGPASPSSKGIVKVGSGINVDAAGVISVPAVSVPVSSVNTKTGAVVLAPSDVGAATSAQGAKADTALQTSQLGQAAGVAKQDDLVTHLAETVTMHGATLAATPNKLIVRDASGRAKVAAPSAFDDIARKDTVDTVQTNLTNHQTETMTLKRKIRMGAMY